MDQQVLIPPPDIKKIIDVLVIKVASNGQEFADMIEKHMAKDKKYDFLRHDNNPYRPYYISELEKTKGEKRENIRDVIFGKEEPEEEEEQEIIVAPEPDMFTLEVPKDLNSSDNQVIKLSA